MGDTGAFSTAFLDGMPVPNAMQLANGMSGRLVTRELCNTLSARCNVYFTRSYDRELLANDIKRQCCIVFNEDQDEATGANVEYKLPSGQLLTLDRDSCFKPFEPLFKSDESASIPTMLVQTVNECPLDNVQEMTQQLMLAGGTTLADGFDKRLITETQ